jgi:serine/threonine protein kinase
MASIGDLGQISDKYVLGKELGRGASAVVYEATSKKTGEKFAVKMINKKLVKTQRLKTEVEILKKVKHEHVLPFIEAVEDSKSVYLVLHYAKGGELFDNLIKRGVYSEKDAGKIIKQILRAIQYLHSVNVAHRDLKLENVLCEIDENGNMNIFVADFGLSRIMDPDEFAGMTTQCGSLEYCAPEVFMSQAYSEAVDLWSIGVITYTLLTGCFPFFAPNKNTYVLYERITNVQYNWDNFPYVSKTAREFVSRLLVKDPATRMTSAQALEHPWIKGKNRSTDLLHTSFTNLKNLRKP